ncbi:MAG: four helix bundle suffix domain-containing protein [Proteobacteria bacterium]|nr:four helix bundle suffix domain-containing protein [Pseudomonadota bacterium]
MNHEPLIPKHGGYRNLKSFQLSQLVYDVTVRFCERYIDRKSRTHDQMVQAARSGVQNIAEGSQASATSKKFELKLTQVARASLEELKLDYEDFLRQRDLLQWERDNPIRQALINRRCKTADELAEWVRGIKEGGQGGRGGQSGQSGQGGRGGRGGRGGQGGETVLSTVSTQSTPISYPCLAANAALVLITVACSLLDRQVANQARDFENQGGFTERLHRVRTANRRQTF